MGCHNTPRVLVVNAPVTISDRGVQMVFREYHGIYEGEKVIARVGYVVHKSFGYSIIGVFANRDRRMEDVVNRSLTSFRLTKP